VRPRAKVTIDSLQEVVHEKSIDAKMNDTDLYLEVVSRSCHDVTHCVTFAIEYSVSETVRDSCYWYQKTTSGKWSMEYQMVKLPT